MAYNEFQKKAAKVYEGGELEHHLDKDQSYHDCGDGLFTFIINELSDEDMDQQTAAQRIQSAINQLYEVQEALNDMDQG